MFTEKPSFLFTDLYELTMGAAYFGNGLFNEIATFSLFCRSDPARRNYYIAAGLEEALTALGTLSFSRSDLTYLASMNLFSKDYLSWLESFGFTGEAWALPEGTVFFANEPLLEITAPVVEAQIVETFLLNALGLPILTATKAARCTHEAKGRQLMEFSLRRTHGMDAGMRVARSTYIAGFSSTSNVLAGKTYGIPVSGTMAHSYVLAFANEKSAFSAYARIFPHNAVFLIDTYDTLQGAENAAEVAREMEKQGHRLLGVRLDSGDMIDLSKKVRNILDSAGLAYVKIFVSSGFDEYKIRDSIEKGAKIDGFGVGTKLGVSADAPYLDIVYKMVAYQNRPVRKFSEGKRTWAGEKQVFRRYDETGLMEQDIIGIRDETHKNATPLLVKVMHHGKRLAPSEPPETIRARFMENFRRLPDHYKTLDSHVLYPVGISEELKALQPELKR